MGCLGRRFQGVFQICQNLFKIITFYLTVVPLLFPTGNVLNSHICSSIAKENNIAIVQKNDFEFSLEIAYHEIKKVVFRKSSVSIAVASNYLTYLTEVTPNQYFKHDTFLKSTIILAKTPKNKFFILNKNGFNK